MTTNSYFRLWLLLAGLLILLLCRGFKPGPAVPAVEEEPAAVETNGTLTMQDQVEPPPASP